MPKLKPETSAARKFHILKAAMVCFSKQGYHQTSMDNIVQQAGLSKGGLYVHFKSKKELFLALLDGYLEEFGLFSVPSSPGSTAHGKLINLLADMVETATTDNFRETSALMTDIWAQNSRDQDINLVAKELYARARLPVTKLIEEGIDEGIFKPIGAGALSNIIIAVFEGLLIQAMIDETAVDWDAAFKTLITMIDGILI